MTYAEMVVARLCVSCGKQNESKYVLCDSCREKRKVYVSERRNWYRQNGICPHCGKGTSVWG